MELNSWNDLLRGKECTYAKKALRHWFPLYKILIRDSHHLELAGGREQTRLWSELIKRCPPWLAGHMNRCLTSEASADQNNFLKSVFDAVDGFLRSSVVGEFPTRLHLIRFFAMELQACRSGGFDAKLSHLVTGLWEYYSQFLPAVRNFQDSLRALLDERVKDTVKLAKWDNMSTYSLIEYSDKVHLSLNKLLREYETDVLDYPFSHLLRKELIGNFVSDQGELVPVSEMPSGKELFPFVKEETISSPAEPLIFDAAGTVSVNVISSELPARLLQADRLFVKFQLTLESQFNAEQADDLPSFARLAYQASLKAEALCLDIFERIDRFRESKASKAIKYRSIHDMFNTLRDEGFSYLRSDVAGEVRCFEHLLSSPGVLSETRLFELIAVNGGVLYKSEEYFVKNIAELNQFGAQMNSPYSKDISQRDVSRMIGYAENMLQKVCLHSDAEYDHNLCISRLLFAVRWSELSRTAAS